MNGNKLTPPHTHSYKAQHPDTFLDSLNVRCRSWQSQTVPRVISVADQWAVGAEHVAFLTNNPACPSDEPDVHLGEYTQLLTQVAESPVAGATHHPLTP